MQDSQLPLAARVRAAKDPRYGVQFYEGLVRKTAGLYAGKVEEDYDDLCSLFRIKVWRALESFDPAKSRVPVERYVFSCLVNLGKDLKKKKRRNESYIEDFTASSGDGQEGQQSHGDKFVARYLVVEEEEAFRELPSMEQPLIPSTLSSKEVRVLVMLYSDYSHAEIALALSISKRQVVTTVGSIREKMADWRPSKAPATPAPAVSRMPRAVETPAVAA